MKEITECYETIGTVKVAEREIPLLDIKLMSDEQWEELAVKNAINNYTKTFGNVPESTEVALKWQRNIIIQMMGKAGA